MAFSRLFSVFLYMICNYVERASIYFGIHCNPGRFAGISVAKVLVLTDNFCSAAKVKEELFKFESQK